MNGIIFNIQKFCVNDGPGIRTTVFFKGCPLSCVWCHNPESQLRKPELMFYREKCTGCGRCAGITAENKNFICFSGAKEICGHSADTEEIMHEVLKDSIFYENSGGGITLSGGEPLFQLDFALEILSKAKKNRLHTAVETCGYASGNAVRAVAENTDLFLFDYKESDPELHRKYTGADNKLILENLRLISGLGKKIILRCPIIPGFNDRDEHFTAIGKLASSLDSILRVEIEPYHSLGTEKYEALGRAFTDIAVQDSEITKKQIAKIKLHTDKAVIKA